MSTPSISLSKPARGFQLGVSTLTYDSFSSTQGSFFWDTKLLEVGAKLASRILGTLAVGRTPVPNTLQDWKETYSVEIARRFLSSTGRFGRLGLQYDHFSPSSERFIQLALDTGVLDSEENQELMKLSFHLFKPLQRESDIRLVTGLDLGTVMSRWGNSLVKIGLNLGWTYHLTRERTLDELTSLTDKTLSSEHFMFSLGPWAEYLTETFQLRVMIPGRLFIDKQWQARSLSGNPGDNTLVVSYPFDLKGPDLWASFVVIF